MSSVARRNTAAAALAVVAQLRTLERTKMSFASRFVNVSSYRLAALQKDSHSLHVRRGSAEIMRLVWASCIGGRGRIGG